MSVPYNESANRLFEQWKNYHQDYVSLVPRYRKLLEQKRALGIALNKIKEADLKDFPVIPFLGIENEEEVWKFINDLTPRQIKNQIDKIDIMISNDYTWRRLIRWCKDSECQIRRHGMSKTYYKYTKPNGQMRSIFDID